MYRPFFKSSIFFLFAIILSCTPKENHNVQNSIKETKDKIDINIEKDQAEIITEIQKVSDYNIKILPTVELLLPEHDNLNITKDFINAFELSIYKKNIKNIDFNINLYSSKRELDNIILKKATPGKIFIGPLTSKDTANLHESCYKGVIVFSFSSNKDDAGDCIYLFNFFPEDEIETLFNYFKSNSRIALLYPENDYGYYINSIIDHYATNSKALIVNRASYKSDLSNAREAIKELSKYELRKYELERQKKILKTKNDSVSKKALKKIERFETAGTVDFTHLILPDYSIRLLQIAPLLPFYDIDPNVVQFVGTGVWDNEIFFNERSLQKSIFPGVNKSKRKDYFDDYYMYYNHKPMRTITMPYDLVGIIAYIINNNYKTEDVFNLLNDRSNNFDGIDGRFSFNKNIITRKLNILKILEGKAVLIE